MFGSFFRSTASVQDSADAFKAWSNSLEDVHFHDLGKAVRSQRLSGFHQADVDFEKVLPQIDRNTSIQEAIKLAAKERQQAGADDIHHAPVFSL